MLKHLAVVDDENDFCEIIAEIATNIGYRVSTFNSSRAFLRSLDRDPCNLLILDIVMPDIDGIEIIGELSRQSKLMDIVLCSGYSDRYLDVAETLSKANGLNIRYKLQKPVNVFDLEIILNDLYN